MGRARLAVITAALILFHRPASASESGWRIATSSAIDLLTSAEADRAASAVAELEGLSLEFAEVCGRVPDARLRILAFRSEEEYEPFRLNSFSPAYFVAGPGQATVVLGRLTKDSIPTLRHEFAHWLMREAGWRLPPWLAEGYAQHWAAEPPAVRRARLDGLRRRPWIPLADLLGEDSAGLFGNATSAPAAYAESWALVEMLLADSAFSTEGQDIVRACASGSGCLELLGADTPAGLARLEADLRNYILHASPSPETPFIPPIPLEVTVRRTSGPELETALASVVMHRGRTVEALGRLDRLIEAGFATPEIWALRGACFEKDHLRLEARLAYEEAWRLGSRDRGLLWRLAVLEQQNPDPDAVVEVLESLLAVAPDHDEARVVLASHYMARSRYLEALDQFRLLRAVPAGRAEYVQRAMSRAEYLTSSYSALD
jgi:tetratricopeptide (TPR) repeat protein